MSTKKILDSIDSIKADIYDLKTGQKLIEKDVNLLRTNHYKHIEVSLGKLWKFSLIVGFFILVMFVDEVQTIIYDFILK